MALTKASYSMISGAVVNALDFGMSPTASAAANKAALLAAINSVAGDGVAIFIPSGTYNCTADITITKLNVTIFGTTTGYRYYGANYGGTTINFTSGTNGFNVSTTASDYFCLRDIVLTGNNAVTNGIFSGGCKLFSNITCANFTGNGLYMTNFTNSTIVENSGFTNNGTGVYVDGASTTPYTLRNCNVRNNIIGIDIKGGRNVLIDKCIIESNSGVGIYIFCFNGQSISQVNVTNTWFENNNYTTGGFHVILDGQSFPADIQYVVFDMCQFNTQSSGPPTYNDIWFKTGSYNSVSRSQLSIGGPAGSSILISGTASNTLVYQCNRGIGSGTAASNVTDNGTFTTIQDYAFTFVGANLITGWTNSGVSPYSSFASTGPAISTLIQTAAVTSVVNSNTRTTTIGQKYFVQVWINQITGQLPTLVIRNGNNTADLYNSQLVNGINNIVITETVSGSTGYMYLTNSAATNGGTFEGVVMFETTRGNINYNLL